MLIVAAGDARINNAKFKAEFHTKAKMIPACGSSNSAVKLSIDELERTSEYKKWIDVCKV